MEERSKLQKAVLISMAAMVVLFGVLMVAARFQKGVEFEDLGCYGPERVDYPVYGQKVAEAVASGQYETGIVLCGTGIGIGIAASKVKGIRVCTCSDVYSAELSKRHNNSNILTMGARVVGVDLAKMIATHWLTAEFEGGRHQRRVDEITAIENGEEL
mgnify:CR=1 FL=1